MFYSSFQEQTQLECKLTQHTIYVALTGGVSHTAAVKPSMPYQQFIQKNFKTSFNNLLTRYQACLKFGGHFNT